MLTAEYNYLRSDLPHHQGPGGFPNHGHLSAAHRVVAAVEIHSRATADRLWLRHVFRPLRANGSDGRRLSKRRGAETLL